MSDFRAGVRDIVAAVLQRRLPELGGRVFRARDWPVQEAEVTAALVYGYEEEKTLTDQQSETYAVACTMAVQIKTEAASRRSVEVEAELERFCEAVCIAVMTAPELLDPDTGRIERIASVKTTLNIDARSGERALGQALIAFDMRWHEIYRLPPPVIDCEQPVLFFRVTPDPSAAAP
jgi:hypothetical protein